MNPHSSITPRPLHRWKSLWLGILVLISLLWAWRESVCWETTVSYRRFDLSHAGSGICLSHWAPASARSSPLQYRHDSIPFPFHWWSQAVFPAPEILLRNGHHHQVVHYYEEDPTAPDLTINPRNAAAAHFMSILHDATPGSWSIFIPHWLIIATFLIPWLTFLIWRSRHLRHLTNAAE